MTAEFQAWYEMNVRQMDGTPMQAAWLAWQHRDDAPLRAPRPAWRVLYDLKWPKRRRIR